MDEKRQLNQITIIIKTPAEVSDNLLKELVKELKHDLTGYGATIENQRAEIIDDRTLQEPPEACVGCKWLKNKECWHEDVYYGQDWAYQEDCYEEDEV